MIAVGPWSAFALAKVNIYGSDILGFGGERRDPSPAARDDRGEKKLEITVRKLCSE